MSSNRQKADAAAAARHRRNRWLIWGGITAVVALAAIIAVVSSSGSDTASAKSTKFETHPVTVDGFPLARYDSIKYAGNTSDPAIGETMPTVHGVSVFDGKPVTIAPNGKPQLIVFAAHWCPHCQAEVPRLVALAKQGAFHGVDVTLVATGTNPGYPNYPPSAWLRSVGWPFPVMADSQTFGAAEAYGIPAYPYFVFVGADGKVAGRATSEVPEADLVANVKALEAGTALPLSGGGASSSSPTR